MRFHRGDSRAPLIEQIAESSSRIRIEVDRRRSTDPAIRQSKEVGDEMRFADQVNWMCR